MWLRGVSIWTVGNDLFSAELWTRPPLAKLSMMSQDDRTLYPLVSQDGRHVFECESVYFRDIADLDFLQVIVVCAKNAERWNEIFQSVFDHNTLVHIMKSWREVSQLRYNSCSAFFDSITSADIVTTGKRYAAPSGWRRPTTWSRYSSCSARCSTTSLIPSIVSSVAHRTCMRYDVTILDSLSYPTYRSYSLTSTSVRYVE